MKQSLTRVSRQICEELTTHAFVYTVLFVILCLGIFVRTYRSFDLLQFYYDQGRDALQVQDIMHGKLTLIGPTTGFEGIFRGPFYYYWLVPAYFWHGNPGTAAAIEGFINALGLLVLYCIGAQFFSRKVGLMAAFLPSLSFYAVKSTRWLSNPAPVWLFGPLAYLCILLGLKRDWRFLPIGLFCLGLTLQMEEAGMGFVTIAVGLFCLFYIQRLRLWQWGIGIGAFLSTFLPLAAFEVRHQFLITHNVAKLLFGGTRGDKSFAGPPEVAKILHYFSGEFGKELFLNGTLTSFSGWYGIALSILVIGLVWALYAYRKSMAVQLALLWLIVPIGFLFYYKKDLFEYYFFGLYPIFFLITAVAIMQWTRFKIGWAVTGLFCAIVLSFNIGLLQSYLMSHVEKGKNTIVLENEWQAIDAIFQSAGNRPFAINVYVPPVIPYTYNYLIPYYAKTHHRQTQVVDLSQAELFYTLHEMDTDHPQFEQAWLLEQTKKGAIMNKDRFGGIFIEERLPTR